MARPRQHRDMHEIEDVPVVNEFSEETIHNEEPPDIENFLADLGINKKEYRCQIKQYPPEGGTPAFFPSFYKGSYPQIDELGTKYGPGKYLYVFTWKIPRTDGNGYKSQMKEMEVVLSDAWDDAHQEYLYQYAIKRRKRLRTLKEKAEMDQIMYGDNNKSSPGNPIESLIDAKNQMVSLGVPIGGGGGTDLLAGDGKGGILALIMGMQQQNSAMQQKSTEMLVTMMNNSQTQLMTLVTAILGQKNDNNSPHASAFKEVTGMMAQMMDLKTVLNPEKQGVVDKIFNLMETVSPQILGMVQMSAQQRNQNKLYQAAAKSDELQTLKGDQQMTDALAAKLDDHYGIQNTNDIMAVMDLERSEVMKSKLKQMGHSTEPRQTTDAPDTAETPATENGAQTSPETVDFTDVGAPDTEELD